jgi:hypothetical protein
MAHDLVTGQTLQELTEQQKEFVRCYVFNNETRANGAAAAKAAGYSEASARQIANQLLDKPHVRRAVAEARQAWVDTVLSMEALEGLRGLATDDNQSGAVRRAAWANILDARSAIATASNADKARAVDHRKVLAEGIADLAAVMKAAGATHSPGSGRNAPTIDAETLGVSIA